MGEDKHLDDVPKSQRMSKIASNLLKLGEGDGTDASQPAGVNSANTWMSRF